MSRTCVMFGELPAAPHSPPPSRVAVVYDCMLPTSIVERVHAHVGGWGAPVSAVPVAAGEALKGLERWQELLAALAGAELDRASLVVALGGGSVADAAGFAAAVWLRGVRWLGVPTTLIGMVDAFIGGKTGLNHQGRKNQLGAFHQPIAVAVLPELLASLPERELRSGWAEILKTALIGDAELFARCVAGERGPDVAGEPGLDTLERAVRVKQDAVAADYRESDQRRVLNLGHTLGHALEALHGPGRIAHGEAVAAGLVFAARVAVQLGVGDASLERVIAGVLERWRLPCAWPPDAGETLLAHMRRDKKRVAGVLSMALPVAAGQIALCEVSDDVLRACL